MLAERSSAAWIEGETACQIMPVSAETRRANRDPLQARGAARNRIFDAEEHVGGEEVGPGDPEDGVTQIAQCVLATPFELERFLRIGPVEEVLARTVELRDDLRGLVAKSVRAMNSPCSSSMTTWGSKPWIECSTKRIAQIDSATVSLRPSALSSTASMRAWWVRTGCRAQNSRNSSNVTSEHRRHRRRLPPRTPADSPGRCRTECAARR